MTRAHVPCAVPARAAVPAAADALGWLHFHDPARPPAGVAGRVALAVPARPLLPAQAVVALPVAGSGDGPALHGVHGAIEYRHDGELLYAVCRCDEADFPAVPGRPPLRQAAAAAYAALFDCLAATGYAHVVRAWNYLPDINRESHGQERYRQFNAGRQDGFLADGRAVRTHVPAACALGTRAGPLAVALLAARSAAVLPVENPRQLSAYAYPPEYGERPPTFARAALLRLSGRERLYVSGTAAIVGHRSVHAGDPVAQTRESLANVAAVCAEAARIGGGRPYAPDELHYTVYVREATTLAAVQRALRDGVGSAAPVLFVAADICRRELLVEIEAGCER